jgi:hypothetical protein
MADNKQKRGAPDRSRVSAQERYEVDYLAKKVGLPAKLVENVIRDKGPMRSTVESYLQRMKRNGR